MAIAKQRGGRTTPGSKRGQGYGTGRSDGKRSSAGNGEGGISLGGLVSRELRERLRVLLQKRATRLGGLTESTVMKVVGGTQLRDLLRAEAPGAAAADVGWAWVAEQQVAVGATEAVKAIQRRLPNQRVPMPYWREMSTVRSGWASGGRATVSAADLRVLQLVEMVFRAIPGVSGDEWYSEGKGEAIWMEVEDQRVVWDRVSRAEEFRGSGGRNMYWKCWALLLSEGRVEGCLGKGPREGTWWQEILALRAALHMKGGPQVTPEASGVIPAEQKKGRMKGRMKGELVVGWMAGAQSGGRAAEERGMM